MITNDFTNPYYNLTVVRSSDMFLGRERELSKFYYTLATRQSVSLLGPRGIGKSSFLYWSSQPEIQAKFPVDLSRHIFVLFDLREYIYKTIEEFFHEICKEIKRQGQRFKDLSLDSEGQGADEFHNLLIQLNEQRFYPVLLMDAFDNIPLNPHFSPEFFAFLRAHATFGRISYVTASIAPLYEIRYGNSVDSSFANIFYSFRLGNLSEEDALELISIPAQRTGIPFTSKEIAWVRKEAGLHPFFLQRVCYALFEEKQQSPNREVELRNVRKKAFDSLLPHFTDIWRHLTDTERAFLQQEAQHQSQEQQVFPELSGSALFRQFVNGKAGFSNLPILLNEQEVKEALNKMDDPVALGGTNLQYLKAVTQRLNDGVLSSASERGKAIRDVLNEALKQLQGSGVRSDMAPDWRLYNILFYRYFRHHLKNEQISARLGFTSTRQFFRSHIQAIEALRNALRDLDA